MNGHRVPVVGSICMDQCMIDVTDVPEVRAGDEGIGTPTKAVFPSAPGLVAVATMRRFMFSPVLMLDEVLSKLAKAPVL